MHTIRLRGPWEVSSDAFDTRHVKGPEDWANLAPAACDRLVIIRRFNAPTGLDDGHVVRLAFSQADYPLSVSVNDEWLGRVVPGRVPMSFVITPHLRPHNRLTMEMGTDSGLLKPPFELQLQIVAP